MGYSNYPGSMRSKLFYRRQKVDERSGKDILAAESESTRAHAPTE